MKYYVIKDGKTINSYIWNQQPYVYPHVHDVILPETEWNIEQYPYPLLVTEDELMPEPKTIVVSDFMTAFQDFIKDKEFTTDIEMMTAFQDYISSMGA